MDLPLELFQDIAQRLSRRDLKQLRLTCKRLAENTVPLLFDSVFLSAVPRDFERAKATVAHHGSLVRTFVVSPLEYQTIDEEIYQYKVDRPEYGGYSPTRADLDKHKQLGYGLYCELQCQEEKAHAELSMHERIRTVLKGAPNVRKVVITCRDRFSDSEVAKYCRWKGCAIPQEEHAVFRLRPLNIYRYRHTDTPSTDLSDTLLAIASVSTAEMTTLVMEPDGTSRIYFRMAIETFSWRHDQMDQMSTFMATLTKLHLNIGEPEDPESLLLETGISAHVLSKAWNLEDLSLDFSTSPRRRHLVPNPSSLPPERLRYTLSDCCFPKLRTLELKGSAMFRNELIPILKKFPKLKHLALVDFHLTDYLWMNLIEEIKLNGNLQSLHLGTIYGHFDDQQPANIFRSWWDSRGSIPKYLLDDGPNPFSNLTERDRQKQRRLWESISASPETISLL